MAFSEIEPFPCAVLAHHYPHVPNWGDMTKFEEWPDADVDVLCGGTPCQSFSVAGLRSGLADPRGNLMLTYLAIAGCYRPRWLVWENVPGVLSSNGGRDFGTFLRGLGELGFGFAYRVLDAQFVRTCRFPYAVPQRRRRVFVVGYLGDWRRAAAVLFDPESLRGHPAPRREAGKDIAPTVAARTRGGGGLGTDFDLDGGIIAFGGNNTSGPIEVATACQAHGGPKGRLDFGSETFLCVNAGEDGTGRGAPIMPVAIQERAVSENPSAGPDGVGVRQDGVSYTLEARTVPQAISYGLTTEQTPKFGVDHALTLTKQSPSGGGQPPAVAFAQNQRGEVRTSDVSPQITCGGGKPGEGYPAVAFDMRGREGGAMPEGPHDTANLRAASGSSSRSYVAQPWAVRRLTPIECERLMGFPDDFTRIPYRGKPADKCPDGPRYKALGNSWAVNVAGWVGERIAMVDAMGRE